MRRLTTAADSKAVRVALSLSMAAALMVLLSRPLFGSRLDCGAAGADGAVLSAELESLVSSTQLLTVPQDVEREYRRAPSRWMPGDGHAERSRKTSPSRSAPAEPAG